MKQSAKSLKVRCIDCRGTGASNPDCDLCDGRMECSIKKAMEFGYDRGDLDVYDDEKHCRCPRYGCWGDFCDLCEGDGHIDADVVDREINRCLFYAVNQIVPPRWAGPPTRRRPELAYLSSGARDFLIENGFATWIRSMLGDEFYATSAGEAEADRRGIPRRFVRPAEPHEIMRLDDDGSRIRCSTNDDS